MLFIDYSLPCALETTSETYVQNMHNLEHALDVYFQEELMEGDNAYHCDKVDAKVPAIKRTLLEKLPHTFVVHLKRFEFDFFNGVRLKIQDRFEFPNKLNLRQYTPEGVDRSSGEDGSSPSVEAPEHYYDYELKGVVVHTGSAFAGHYYSYVKERGGGPWMCMDDTSITLWDPANMDECCFGGQGPGGHTRPNSAYMLFYERKDSLEPIFLCPKMMRQVSEKDASSKSVDAVMQDVVSESSGKMEESSMQEDVLGVPSRSEIAEEAGEGRRGKDCTVGGNGKKAGRDSIPFGMPACLYADVVQDNLMLAHAAHWTAPSHTCFLKEAIMQCLQLTSSSDCHDVRHSIASGSQSGVKTMSCDTRDTSTKRMAIDKQNSSHRSHPIAVVAVAVTDSMGKETLATLLALKYCLSVLNYLPRLEEEHLGFFMSCVESGLERGFARAVSMDLLSQNLMWCLPDSKESPRCSTESCALNPDQKMRERFAECARRVVAGCSSEFTLDSAKGKHSNKEGEVLVSKVGLTLILAIASFPSTHVVSCPLQVVRLLSPMP
jgi:hypothetical protein